ncbi:MAG: DUF5652 family protein [Patescibacteria group bacterium]|nr:DUF5652 family protein [Patescibacteria group bacterium]
MTYNITTNQEIALVLLAVWELAWKGLALWRAAHRNQTKWFIALLFINSAGLLPIMYLLATAPLKESEKS